MNYLTNYYKNKAAALQRKLYLLESEIEATATANETGPATTPNPNFGIEGIPTQRGGGYGTDTTGLMQSLKYFLKNMPDNYPYGQDNWEQFVNMMMRFVNYFNSNPPNSNQTGAELYYNFQQNWDTNFHGIPWPLPRIPAPDGGYS